MMWQINRQTRLSSDDYMYSFKFNPGFVDADPAGLSYERIASFSDYYQSLSRLYVSLTGRIVPHAILQIFLLLPGWVFDIFNTLAFFALTCLYASWISAKRHNLRIPLWLLVSMLFYLAVKISKRNFYYPAFSCNYLWTQLIVFTFLIPYRKLMQEPKESGRSVWLAVLMLLSGIIAGGTNEPVAPALLLGLGAYGLFSLLENPRFLPLWFYAGMAGLLIGFGFLYLAPGNNARAVYESTKSGVQGIGFNPANLKPITRDIIASAPTVLLGIWGLLSLSKIRLKQTWRFFLFVLLAFSGTIFVLLFVPIYSNRMSMLYVGFLTIFGMRLFMLKWGGNRVIIATVILLILVPFGARLNGDFVWAQRSEQEYQLFLRQIEECPSDSCLVVPRAYHESLTRENWAKPVATYYGKNYLWIMDLYNPELRKNWREVSYTKLEDAEPKQVKLEGLHFVNHDPYSRTLYVTIKGVDDSLAIESMDIMIKSADLPNWLEALAKATPKWLLNHLLPSVQVHRPQPGFIVDDAGIFAISMPIDNSREDILILSIRQKRKILQNLLLYDVRFH